MLKIAITGNIASGKSAFENFVKEAGFKVLCLDNLTHKLYEEDDDIKEKISKTFGTLNRSIISQIIFSDPAKKKQLEDIIHPKLLFKMKDFFEENKKDELVFVSAAILFEAAFDKFFDKIILISADFNIRLQRLMDRNLLTQEDAKLRIKSQTPDIDKLDKVNFVVENNGNLDILKSKANDVLNILLKDKVQKEH